MLERVLQSIPELTKLGGQYNAAHPDSKVQKKIS